MIERSRLGRTSRARDNPFAVHRTDALAFRFPHGNWRNNLARLSKLNYRAAIVGPQGSGKTTLLHELLEMLQEVGLQPELARATGDRETNHELVGRLLSSVESRRIILLDSAEQLSRLHWYQLVWKTRGRGGLIVTVHRRCLLPTWVRCEVSSDLTQELLGDLGFSPAEAGMLVASNVWNQRHRGNLRDFFRTLYDAFADGKLLIHPTNERMAETSRG